MKVELLNDYDLAKTALKEAKKVELELRLKICDELLSGKNPGTHNFNIDGVKAKAVSKLNYKIDEDELDMIWESLSPEEQNVIRFKPSLKLKDYKELEDELLINNAITVSPAMSTLEIIYES